MLDLIFEILFELIAEAVLWFFFKVMSLIVPEKKINSKAKERIKSAIIVFSLICLLSIFAGAILKAEGDIVSKTVSDLVLYIPLGICGVQIALGIILKVIKVIKAEPKK